MVRTRKCASKCHKNEWQHWDLTAVVRLQANVKPKFFSKSLLSHAVLFAKGVRRWQTVSDTKLEVKKLI